MIKICSRCWCILSVRYCRQISSRREFPTKAIQLAQDMYFDIIIVYVTINYNGTQFGGLEVYKSLVGRYGNSSIIAYSQYINDELLKMYGLPFNFIEKSSNLVVWARVLADELARLRQRQTCFVAMPFGDKYKKLYDVIKAELELAGYRSIRIDEVAFTKSIVDAIFDEIRKAKLVIFVAVDRNPNVFYEAGYAIALGKEVLTITDFFDHLPFDVRDRNAVSFKGDPLSLTGVLVDKINALTVSS